MQVLALTEVFTYTNRHLQACMHGSMHRGIHAHIMHVHILGAHEYMHAFTTEGMSSRVTSSLQRWLHKLQGIR